MKVDQSASRRAQTSIEILLLLGVALLVLLVFLTLSQSESVEVSQAKIATEAKNTVSTLASAAKDVYAQGVGARKRVLISIPQGYESNQSFVADKAIKLHAAGDDYVEILDFEVHGSLPQSEGKQWVWIVSEGTMVRIGQSMVSLSTPSLNVLMAKNSTKIDGFTLRSTWGSAINVSIEESWQNPEIDLGIDKDSLSLDPLNAGGVSATFASSAAAAGFNNGYLRLEATDGITNETVLLPLMVEIAGFGETGAPELTMRPNMFNVSLRRNESATRTFQVCTNSQTRLSSVQFTTSEGEPGDWVADTAALGSLGPGRCQPKILTIMVPANASSGPQTGYVYATGVGSAFAEDSIGLAIDVYGSRPESLVPAVSNMSVYPKKPYTTEPIVVSAMADDSASGNNLIKRCELKLDNSSSWAAMDPVDGSYDEASEVVAYTYFQGLGMGMHELTIRCHDAEGNIGRGEGKFHVMRDLLFVKSDKTKSASESQWIDWIQGHDSAEGYPWDLEVIEAKDVIGLDLPYYSAVVFAEWAWKQGLASPIKNYSSSGGEVVLLGSSNLHGARELGMSAHPGNPSAISSIHIKTNDTYITQPLLEGTVQIADKRIQAYRLESDYSGISLAVDENNSQSTMLGAGKLGTGNAILWGVAHPDLLNRIGSNITIRVLDRAIMESGIKPG
jgi:uncharacterized protein (UPF0333 family)